jgi:PAN-like domain
MLTPANGFSRRGLGTTAVLAAMALSAASALAQAPATVPAPATVTSMIEKTTGMWVEGPGFDIKYGGNYDECAQRCLSTSSCVMIEYYRPEKKCNMYNTIRPLKTGGSSIVGTKKPAKP